MIQRLRSLNLIVAALLLLCFLLLSGVLIWNQFEAQKKQAFEEASVDLRALLLISQARIEREMAARNFASVESEITTLNLLDDVKLSAVIDESGVVRFSSNFIIVGHAADSQLHQFDRAAFAQAQKTYKMVLVADARHDNIHVYYPLALGASRNSLRPDHIGVLYVHWSMARPYRYIQQQAWREFAYMLAVLGLVSLLLLTVLRRLVLQPVLRLRHKADAIVAGEQVDSFSIEGVAEIAGLSHAINRMNLKMSANLQEVRRSEERWAFALEGAGDGVQDWDVRNGHCYYSPRFRELLGLGDTEPGCDGWLQQVHPVDRSHVERRLQRHLQGLSDYCTAEYRVQLPDGGQRFVLMRGKVAERQDDGRPVRFIATHTDVTARRRMEDALRTGEEKYRQLFEMAQEGIWVIDAGGNTTMVNSAMADMLGYRKDEMLGRHIFEFMDENARLQAQENLKRREQGIEEQHDFEWLSRSGRRLFTTMHTAPLYDSNGDYAGAIAGVMDITERRRAEEKIRQQALFDELTRLPNRRMLNERLAQEQARALRHEHTGALLFIDLDHFKNVNDSLGHPVGDALLVAIAERLQQVVRDEDTLARLGGDEFVVLLPELDDGISAAAAKARNVALKIQDVLTEAFDIAGHKLTISCSIGIALYPLDQDSIHDILKQADTAMYRAKQEGRGTLCIFSKAMQAELEHNLRLQMLLPGALQNNQFELHFQAQFNDRREVIGAEVLLRWREPDLGMVRPDQFIRAAEESGFIVQLGDWVLRRACEQLRQWVQQGLPATFERLAINISARQFAQDDFAQRVQAFVAEAGIRPQQIELEITESMLLNRLEQVVEKMRGLHTMGFYIALDDFGTGYSSLSYLRSLPLHKLKIDQAFVRDIQNDKNDRAIVETIIAMARHMELDVIAEGVEDESQFEFLRGKGCLQYQGYHFARPVPADVFFQQWGNPDSR